MAITAPVSRGTATSTANNTTAAVNCSGAATAGNLLLYFVANNTGGAATLSSVSGGGATWAVVESKVGSGAAVSVAWCIVPGGGIADTTTITGTLASSESRKAMALVEIGVDGSWVWPASPVDKHTNATGSSTSSWSSGTTAATTQADELVINAYGNAGNTTAFAVGGGSGYALAPFNSGTGLLVVSAGSTPRSLAAEYKIVSATGAQSDTNAVTTTSGVYANAIVTFAPTVAAGTTSTKAGTAAFGSPG